MGCTDVILAWYAIELIVVLLGVLCFVLWCVFVFMCLLFVFFLGFFLDGGKGFGKKTTGR